MKKVLFVIGHDYAGQYEATRELFDKNYIYNILLLDYTSILERFYYKEKILESYEPWISKLSDLEKFKIVSSEMLRRIETTPEIDNIVITGCLTIDEIKYMIDKIHTDDFNIYYVNATREVLYRNYTLYGKHNLSFVQFNEFMDEIEREKLKQVKDNSSLVYNRATIKDNLYSVIGAYFGEEIEEVPLELYQWPIEPTFQVLEHDLYGTRPVHMILGKPKFHSGFDITAETNTEIMPSNSGIVVYAGLDERIFSGQSKWNQRYGNMIEIVDDYGRREIYAHLREIYVQEGNRVNKRDIIGLSGCSGGARVPHLHFEVRKANIDHSGKINTIDPLILLPERDLDSLREQFQEKPYDSTWRIMKKNPWGLTDEDIPYANSKKLIR